MGRPTTYTEELADTLVEGISAGVTLRELCRTHGVAFRTVYNWMDENKEFAARIARARVSGFDAIAEECVDIADDARNDWMERRRVGKDGEEESDGVAFDAEHVQRSKLRIETRLKLLAKWDPKRFGDKQQVEHSGSIGVGDRLARALQEPKGEEPE